MEGTNMSGCLGAILELLLWPFKVALGSLKFLFVDAPLGILKFIFIEAPKAFFSGIWTGLTSRGSRGRSRGLFGSTYQERYRHRRAMGYGSEKARRMAKGGCYVATSVYGSYDCPEVWTLRRYRDERLAELWYGRLFIRVYYAVSPTLVRWFGDTSWFQCVCRTKLDRLVTKLQGEGFASTPYRDREW